MLDDLSAKTMSNSASGEASVSSTGDQTEPPKPPAKKKRNQPGMPDPDAEVIALSPKTLMATNRFVCEICNKGFQRDQNLQLHRRGHNLPWKLRQRSSKEVKKKVYVCPELSCVHHDPARALGDLTGIKKHFCRKHGEKKWKCERCSKKYAVQSDWKAHTKICGTKEYKCDCGTLFSRRDSFITHRAFCDALAEESVRNHPNTKTEMESKAPVPTLVLPAMPPQQPQSPQPPPVTPSTAVILPIQNSVCELPENPSPLLQEAPSPMAIEASGLNVICCTSTSCSSSSSGNTSSTVFASLFASTAAPTTASLPSRSHSHPSPGFSDFIQTVSQPECRPPTDIPPSSSTEPISLCLSTNHGSSIFNPIGPHERMQYALPSPAPPLPAMSATFLLQRAAQIGAAASGGGSLLRGLGLVSSTSPSPRPPDNLRWNTRQVERESGPGPSGLGLSLPCDEGSGLKELMLGSSSVFGPKHPTLDFLGLGMAAGGTSSGGISALITSIGGGLDVAAASSSFGGGEYGGKEIGRSS